MSIKVLISYDSGQPEEVLDLSDNTVEALESLKKLFRFSVESEGGSFKLRVWDTYD